ncbi:Ribulose-phosphate 3 epimerase family protein [Candidatus Gugararchaeum adminiculabundum]|nr:Ribulose-phosphate 3 epimerase family protein [Candidatus Gugararchaeum adminiculabundum]
MAIEVIAAVLVKSREDLMRRISLVKGVVSAAQIDVMDNEFVPNKTIWPNEFGTLPGGIPYELHWMVFNPEKWIIQVPGNHLHLVHIETVKDANHWNAIKQAAKTAGGKLGLVINPPTPIEKLTPFIKDVSRVMVMGVNPGFSGQSFIPETADKISAIAKRFPKIEIEVDGGVGIETGEKVSEAGADKLAAASSIYAAPNLAQAVKEIKEAGIRGQKKRKVLA